MYHIKILKTQRIQLCSMTVTHWTAHYGNRLDAPTSQICNRYGNVELDRQGNGAEAAARDATQA